MNQKNEWLKKYDYLNTSINKLIEEKQRWKSRAEKCTTTITGMPHGGDGESPRELAICEMIDCESEINKLIDQLHQLRRQIKNYIIESGDSDPQLLVVLWIEK